jgi:hypothetical protein
MQKYMWTTLFIVGLCGVLLVVKAFGASAQTQIRMSNAVMILTNAAPDVGPVDVYIDYNRVIENLHMADEAFYTQVAPGNHLIDVVPAGETVILIKTTELAFEAGHTYQLALDGLMADWSVALVALDVTVE